MLSVSYTSIGEVTVPAEVQLPVAPSKKTAVKAQSSAAGIYTFCLAYI